MIYIPSLYDSTKYSLIVLDIMEDRNKIPFVGMYSF